MTESEMRKLKVGDIRPIAACDCGHYELTRLVVRQLGKTQCRKCAIKINHMLARIYRGAMGRKA